MKRVYIWDWLWHGTARRNHLEFNYGTTRGNWDWIWVTEPIYIYTEGFWMILRLGIGRYIGPRDPKMEATNKNQLAAHLLFSYNL